MHEFENRVITKTEWRISDKVIAGLGEDKSYLVVNELSSMIQTYWKCMYPYKNWNNSSKISVHHTADGFLLFSVEDYSDFVEQEK